ncbi:unnamed protein product [Camellia sinensis]
MASLKPEKPVGTQPTAPAKKEPSKGSSKKVEPKPQEPKKKDDKHWLVIYSYLFTIVPREGERVFYFPQGHIEQWFVKLERVTGGVNEVPSPRKLVIFFFFALFVWKGKEIWVLALQYLLQKAEKAMPKLRLSSVTGSMNHTKVTSHFNGSNIGLHPCQRPGGAQTNSTTRSNPAGDARLPAVGGLGSLGLPEMFDDASSPLQPSVHESDSWSQSPAEQYAGFQFPTVLIMWLGHNNWIFTGWSRQCGFAEKDKLPNCGLKNNSNMLIGLGLAVCDLSNLVKPQDIIITEHLTTLLAIVPKYSQKDWLSSYKTLTAYVKFPKYALYTVTLFSRDADNFRTKARGRGFQIRDFEYNPETQESRKQELEKLMQDQETLRNSLCNGAMQLWGGIH